MPKSLKRKIGTRSNYWFYIQKEDVELLNKYIQGEEWEDNHYFMDVHYEENSLVFLHLRVLYLEFLVPLVENVVLDKDFEAHGPRERVVTV